VPLFDPLRFSRNDGGDRCGGDAEEEKKNAAFKRREARSKEIEGK